MATHLPVPMTIIDSCMLNNYVSDTYASREVISILMHNICTYSQGYQHLWYQVSLQSLRFRPLIDSVTWCLYKSLSKLFEHYETSIFKIVLKNEQWQPDTFRRCTQQPTCDITASWRIISCYFQVSNTGKVNFMTVTVEEMLNSP